MTQAAFTPNPAAPPAFDPEHADWITVVVETSKGSRNRFGYDRKTGTFRVRHVLAERSAFPHAFGFVPSTTGRDGAPLDVLVFLDEVAGFFVHSNGMRGVEFAILARSEAGIEAARAGG